MYAFLRSLLFNRYGNFKWCIFGCVFQQGTGKGVTAEFLTPFPCIVSDYLSSHGIFTDWVAYRDFRNSAKIDLDSPDYDPSYKLHSFI